MKTLFTTILTLSIAASTFAQGIQFFEGAWGEAQGAAEKQEKLIFVDAYAVWCGPCKAMAKNVFPNEKVGEFFNKHFVSMQIDMERGMGLEFAKQYPVRAYPTLFFMDSKGKILKTVVGAQSIEGLLSIAKGVLDADDKSLNFAAEYEKGKREPELIYGYVRALNKAGKPSLKISNEYLRSQKDLTTPFNLKFILEAATEADSKVFDWLIQYRKEIAKVTSEDEVRQRILDACRNTAQKAIEYQSKDLVADAIDKVKKYYSDKAEAFEGQAWMDFYLETKDAPNFNKTAKNFAKRYIFDDAHELQSLTKTIVENFKEDKNSMNLAEDLAKRATEVGQTSVYHLIYADVLYRNGKKEQALGVAKQALELAKAEGSSAVRNAEMYINRLQG